MARRSTPLRKTDPTKFPVRIRIAIPEDGLGAKLDGMTRWLHDRVGVGGYASHGGNIPGRDASCYYFNDARVAADFVEEFGLELVLPPKTGFQ